MKKSTVLIILLHLCYWALLITRLYNTYIPSADAAYQKIHFNQCLDCLLGFIIFYIIYSFIFPYFIQKSKPVTDASALILFFIILATIVGLPLIQVYFHQYQQGKYEVNMISLSWSLLSFSLLALFVKGFTTWALEVDYKRQLEKNNLESNLALLKARINPHFLFNTLNNIDVLIEKDATAASTYLKKLSDILRFTLYESPSETIPLSKEANYIREYIELQQIRTSNADFVKFSFEPGDGDLQVAPMLFIPFIENAFKYCTNKKIKNAILISISTKKNQVIFGCNNAYNAEAITTYEASSGLGLELIKSRLELLYPKNHQLAIHKTTDRFNVDLTITLHDNKLPDN
jgi:two-component system LytT family sensor kinase